MTLRDHIAFMDAIRAGRFEEFIEEFGPADRVDMMRDIEEVYPLPKRPDPKRVEAMADKYRVYDDITSMILSQFIMMEMEINQGGSSDINLATIIIRPNDEEDYDNSDVHYEREHEGNILDEDVLDVSSCILSMFVNREHTLMKRFAGVLYDAPVEGEEGEEDAEESAEAAFSKNWFFYAIIRDLAGEDITKYDFVQNMRMSDVLVEMAYRRQRDKIIEARRKEEEARQRAASLR